MFPKQFVSFAQLIYFQYFGVFIEDMSYPLFGLTHVPSNFPMSLTITAPIMLQDGATNPNDIATLQSTENSIVCMHQVSSTTFNHADFILGITAYRIVYEAMADFWVNSICPN